MSCRSPASFPIPRASPTRRSRPRPPSQASGGKVDALTWNRSEGPAVKLLCAAGRDVCRARVGILGLTFKEDVPDLRNSRVPDIVRELEGYGIRPLVHDPLGDPEEARDEYGIALSGLDEMESLDALVLAVAHRDYLALGAVGLAERLSAGGVLVDVKSAFGPGDFPAHVRYWSL